VETVRLLNEEEFAATAPEPMIRAEADDEPPFDFWSYFGAIPSEDFEGRDCSTGSVTYVYRDTAGSFEHVLVNSDRANVFMVLVLDRRATRVVGHRLINLNREYGLET